MRRFCLLAATLASCTPYASELAIGQVVPASGPGTIRVPIEITGAFAAWASSDLDDGETQFHALTSVTVGGVELADAVQLDDTRIQGFVPVGLPPGPADVVVALGTQTITLRDGYVVEPDCYARWRDGSIQFGEPSPITEVNSTEYDRDPYLSLDERTLWLSSVRSGGNEQLLVARRGSRAEPFSPPVVDAEFDSDAAETKISFSEDGLYAALGSNRTGSSGVDVWASSRASVADPWPAPVRLAAASTASSDHDPTISGDGLRLYIAPSDRPKQRIVVATRAARDQDFGATIEIPELDSGQGDADPSPTPDDSILVYASYRAGGPAGGNLWYATRSPGGAFSAPRLVPGVNTDAAEGDPHLSVDGCRVYFASNRGASWDLFVAVAPP